MGIGLPIGKIETVPDSGPDIVSEASAELAGMDTFTANYARSGFDVPFIDADWEKGAIQELAKTGGKTLSPEELNEKYKNVESPFKTPTNETVAMFLDDEGKKRRELKQAIADGPGSDFYKGTVNFAQGIVAHALDPVEFGVGAAGGWAFKGAGVLMSKVSPGMISKVGEYLAKGTGFAFDAAEGIASNAALEPYMYNSAKAAQTEYSVKDAITNVVGGGLAFPALKYVGGKGVDAFKSLPDSTKFQAMKNALGQIYAGKKPDVSVVPEVFHELSHGIPEVKLDAPDAPKFNYEYVPKDVNELKASPVYVASKQAGTLRGGSRPTGDLRFGDEGMYFTDNPHHANNIAAHPLNTDGPAGTVYQHKIEDLNLVDLDVAGREVVDQLNLSPETKLMIEDATDVKDAYDIMVQHMEDDPDLGDAPVKELFGALKEAGYDGFKYGDDVDGHNSGFIFPDSEYKAVPDGEFDSDVKSIKPIDIEKLKQKTEHLMSPENDMHFDPQLKAEMDAHAPTQDVDIAKDASEKFDSLIKVVDSLEKAEIIKDKKSLEAFKKIKENKVKGEQQIKALEEFAECMLSGMD